MDLSVAGFWPVCREDSKAAESYSKPSYYQI